ncbi:MAG TPA: (Fe-S)-binding protein [Gammaproteobacteria bacterium]|nr:(Fe-S)-binding protein [Gammaproteobacteria bacterium]
MSAAFPLADADKCVKCALCLPHCPTYRVTKDEGESPRGRIALMQALATGALEASPRLAEHLDHCLACRACEAVCPAEVPYGKLIDAARVELRSRGYQEPWVARHFASHMRRPLRRRLLHRSLRLAQRSGLARLAERFGPAFLKRLLQLAPAVPPPKAWREHYAPRKSLGLEVSLFLGCVADMTQPQVSVAAIAVLNAIGVDVRVPQSQVCCGAMDQHAGRSAQAASLARDNLKAFGDGKPVLGTASGCLATLEDYPLIVGDDGVDLAYRAEDISSYLARNDIIPRIEFQPWKARVLVQQPCTLRNVLQGDEAVLKLLNLIPDLKVKALPASLGCCGAAGSYMLTQAQQADAFAEQFVDAIAAEQPHALVTSNVGCALHLGAALRRRGLEIRVMHPVELLAQQLPESMYRPGI